MKKRVIFTIAIAVFLVFSLVQLLNKTIMAKMLASTLVPYRVMSIETYNNGSQLLAVKEHVFLTCDLGEFMSRAEPLDLVLHVSRCLKRNTLTRNTQMTPNYSFDYLSFFSEDSGSGDPVQCGINVSLFHSALAALGFTARKIDLSNDELFSSHINRFLVNFFNSSTAPPFDRHSALEYFDPELKKWVYVDIHYGYVVYPPSSENISIADLDELPLSAAQIQDAGDFVLVPIHEWPSPYSSDRYAKYFSQIAIGKNHDPFKKLHPLRDEFGNAYRSFCKRHRDRSTFYEWLNWEIRDSCKLSTALLNVTEQ